MNEPLDEERDPVLDVFLEDMLSERAPPDLTQRILEAWKLRQCQPGAAAAAGPINGSTGRASTGYRSRDRGPLDLVTGPSPRGAAELVTVRSERPVASPRAFWGVAAALVAMLVLGFGLGVAALKWMPGNLPQDLATHEGSPVPPPVKRAPQQEPAAVPKPERPVEAVVAVPAESPEEAPFGRTSEGSSAHVAIAPASWPTPDADTTLVAYVDRSLASVWQQRTLQPSPHASDEQWCRRVFVRLLGRIPTVEELNTFVADTAPDKQARLVERLQSEPGYSQEFARYWAAFWTNTLLGRSTGTQATEPASRAVLEDYFVQAWSEDRSFRTVAYELLSATGTGKPGSADFNPAANFLLATYSPDAVQTTSLVSRVFLGQRAQCSQCHDHPANPGREQAYFWQLNAFFRQLDVQRDGATQLARLVNRDAAEDEVFFEQMDGYTRAAYPVLPDGTTLPTSGKLAEINRRELLAQWISQSRELPRAVVNRVWAHFFGYGFTQPVDDMGEHNPPLHAELLDQLAEQFAAHDYSLQKLTRWMALSDAFRRSSQVTEHNVADAPERGSEPLFSRYYTRQMQPEAVYESLRLVADARQSGQLKTDADRTVWLGQFAPGRVPEEGVGPGSVGQSLIVMQAPVMQDAVSSERGAVLSRVLASNMSIQEKLEHLFLAAVARKPNASEQALAEKMIAAAGDRPQTALEDIWWALLNSNEFLLDH